MKIDLKIAPNHVTPNGGHYLGIEKLKNIAFRLHSKLFSPMLFSQKYNIHHEKVHEEMSRIVTNVEC